MAPIHSPRSLALASDVARPTIRMGDSSWLLMYRILDVITCTQPHRNRVSPNTLTALCTSIQSKQHAWHGSSNEFNRAGECSRRAPQWLPTLLSRPIDDTRLQYPMPGNRVSSSSPNKHSLRRFKFETQTHLDGGPVAAANEVELVDDEEGDVLHVLALLPAAAQHVPLLGRGDDDVALLQRLGVRRRLANQLHHVQAQPHRTKLHRQGNDLSELLILRYWSWNFGLRQPCPPTDPR